MSRILLVTPVSPWGSSFGGRQRTALLYRALAELMPVDVLLVSEGSENRAESGDRAEILASLSWKEPPLAVARYAVNPWVDGWCRSNLDWAKYSVVVGRYLTPIAKMTWPASVRTVVDCDDAIYRYVPVLPGPAGRLAAAARGWIRHREVKSAIARYDHVFFCSHRDHRLCAAHSSSVLPNAVQGPLEPMPAANGSSGNLLMVGAMWYPPNRHGVEWFLDRCWPRIATRCRELRLRIVGPAPQRDRERWAQAVRTEAPGFVEDLRAEYSRALFAIAPIHYGGGTCIKFLEAAAHCRVCVATRHVLESFSSDFRESSSIPERRDSDRMVEECVMMCEDARRRTAAAEHANATVMRLYNVERFTGAVRETVRRLAQSSD